MDNSQHLELKRQSLQKWRAIVDDLIDGGKGQFSLCCDDCGYCQIYLKPDDDFGWTTGDDCKPCPLYQKNLCISGKSWFRVYEWYVAKHEPEWYTKERRVDTLIEAERMVEGIEEDLYSLEHK